MRARSGSGRLQVNLTKLVAAAKTLSEVYPSFSKLLSSFMHASASFMHASARFTRLHKGPHRLRLFTDAD